jgi:hypothetical protein
MDVGDAANPVGAKQFPHEILSFFVCQ